MASDLSKIIQDTIVSTIFTNTSKDIEVLEVLISSKESLLNKNIAVIPLSLKFENLESQINFIYTAHSSSYIFNSIMGEDSEILFELNDDISDAIKEINSQISGSLETSFNVENFQDLGKCNNSTNEIEILSGSDYKELSKLVLLKLKAEDIILEIYLNFNDEISPYLEEFMKSPLETIADEKKTNTPEEEQVESNNTSDEKDTNKAEEEKESSNTSDEEKNDITDTSSSDEINEDSKSEEINIKNKQNKKIKLLIIIISSLLGLIIVIILIMFFLGMFDKNELKVNDLNKTKISKRDMILSNIKNKQITYKSSMINKSKLNKRLSLLTKYEILEEDILAKYKLEEKERLYKIKMKRFEEFASRNKEELIFKDDIKTSKLENRFKNKQNNNTVYTNNNMPIDENLTFINMNASDYKKYKNIINKEKTKSTLISICKSDFKTKIYIGPLYIDLLINNIMKQIKNNEAKIISITRDDFNKRCDF